MQRRETRGRATAVKEDGRLGRSALSLLPLALDLKPGCTEAVLGLARARVRRQLEAGQARADNAPAAFARDVGDVGEGRAVLAGGVAPERRDAAAT